MTPAILKQLQQVERFARGWELEGGDDVRLHQLIALCEEPIVECPDDPSAAGWRRLHVDIQPFVQQWCRDAGIKTRRVVPVARFAGDNVVRMLMEIRAQTAAATRLP